MKNLFPSLHRYKTIVAFAVLSLTIICCHSTSYLIPSQADVPIAQTHWQTASLDELNKGYSIYADKCTNCHDMKNPKDFSADDWTNHYMPSMGKKAKLNDIEYQLVLHYVLTKREELINAKK
jgi:hypothetical protein